MARQPSVFTTLAVLIAAAAMYEPPAIGQSADVFTLGFEGPRSLAGRADTQVYTSYHATLAHQGEGNGAGPDGTEDDLGCVEAEESCPADSPPCPGAS